MVPIFFPGKHRQDRCITCVLGQDWGCDVAHHGYSVWQGSQLSATLGQGCLYVVTLDGTASFLYFIVFRGSVAVIKPMQLFKCLNPFPNKPWILCVCCSSFLKTLWVKGEIARNKKFLLFSQCFLPFWRTLCYIHQI